MTYARGWCWWGLVVLATASAFGITVPLHLSWDGDPATTVTVSWERDTAGRGTVECGLTTNYGITVSDPGGHRWHRITLKGLEPGTLYHYRASSEDGFQMADRTFWTAPAPTASLHFVVHGDFQGGLDTNWARTVVSRIAGEAPQLVIQMGDLSDEMYSSDPWPTWLQLFGVITEEVERVVFMPAAGNHDEPSNGSSFYWRMFALPERPAEGRYYSYNAGNIHFVVLCTDIDIASQTNWLARDLQAAANDTNVTWIIPYFHRPPYSWGGHEGNEVVKSNWCPLFVNYEVDLALSGHSHTYQRSVPIRGITYLVTGGGGATLYATSDDPGLAFHTTCYHYVSAQVTGSVMRRRGIRSDGQVFDDQTITNEGRFVRVEPAFPRRGGAVTIRYDNTYGPLSGAGTVYIHLGVDGFSGAMVSSAMTYNAGSGLWEYPWTVPATTMCRLVWAFYDGASTWDNNYGYNWQALLDPVTFDPPAPQAGSNVVIRYEDEMGPIGGHSPLYACVAFNNWEVEGDPALALTNNPASGCWEATVAVPPYAEHVDVAFHDGSEWDINYGHNWHADVAGATALPPWPAAALAAAGTPAVSTNPPTVQNNIGDNFDIPVSGTALAAADTSGFGDFGRMYAGYDSSNLYLGGIGCDLGGSNNVFLLFLGFDTLSDNAESLWHKSGFPNALDCLHNLAFADPLDIAVVFGDEYGDAPDYTNFTYGGCDFGQGIYYIGTNSSVFVPVGGAMLSQFDGTNSTPCATTDDDGDRRTERWELSIPWGSLNASSVTSIHHLLVAGIVASDSTNGNDRYLSSTYVGQRIYGSEDVYGNRGYNFTTIVPEQILLGHEDYDADGLPNQWEHGFFGSARGPAADDDSDADLSSNWGEYVADTDPTNNQSWFSAQCRGGSSTNFVVQWTNAAGRTYSVLKSTNLMSSFSTLADGLYSGSYTDATHSFERAFYRVGVDISP